MRQNVDDDVDSVRAEHVSAVQLDRMARSLCERGVAQTDQFRERGQVELLHHTPAVDLYGFLFRTDARGDPLVQEAARDERADLRLARREPLQAAPHLGEGAALFTDAASGIGGRRDG